MAKPALIEPGAFVLPPGIHLGSATCTPALRQACDAVGAYHAQVRAMGMLGNEAARQAACDTRAAIGQLLGAPASVFFADSCTDALALVAQHLRLGPQDVVITAATPYTVPWMTTPAALHLVQRRSTEAYLEAIEKAKAAPGRVILVVEAVDYVDGRRLDVPALHSALEATCGQGRGVLVADAAQWRGVIEAPRFADIICFPGNKWAAADGGIGFVWVAPHLIPGLLPQGLDGQGDLNDKLDALERLKPKRSQPLWTLRHSVRTLLGVGGMPAMAGHIAPLVSLATERLRQGGAPVISPENPQEQSWNVCLSLAGHGAATFAQAKQWCKAAHAEDGVLMSVGGEHPRVRLTPYLFTSEDDVAEAVERILRRLERS